jgi:hypothetical protein
MFGSLGTWSPRTVVAGIAAWRATVVSPITAITATGIGIVLRTIMVFARRLARPLGDKVQIQDDVPGILPLFLLCFIFHGYARTFICPHVYMFNTTSV